MLHQPRDQKKIFVVAGFQKVTGLQNIFGQMIVIVESQKKLVVLEAVQQLEIKSFVDNSLVFYPNGTHNTVYTAQDLARPSSILPI